MIYIGVIHPYHLKTCLIFTNAKKNVLCEKPLAMNSREVQEILASAKKNDVFLMEVESFPTTGTCQEVSSTCTHLHTAASFRPCGPDSSRPRLS